MGPKPLGWMIVDSLDTLMIMDCPEEVSRARDWIKNDLDYTLIIMSTHLKPLLECLVVYYQLIISAMTMSIWIKRYNWPMHYTGL